MRNMKEEKVFRLKSYRHKADLITKAFGVVFDLTEFFNNVM